MQNSDLGRIALILIVSTLLAILLPLAMRLRGVSSYWGCLIIFLAFASGWFGLVWLLIEILK